MIVNDHVRVLDALLCTQCDQTKITWPGANQIDFAILACALTHARAQSFAKVRPPRSRLFRNRPRLQPVAVTAIHRGTLARVISSFRSSSSHALRLENCNHRAADSKILALPADKATFRDRIQTPETLPCFDHQSGFEEQ